MDITLHPVLIYYIISVILCGIIIPIQLKVARDLNETLLNVELRIWKIFLIKSRG